MNYRRGQGTVSILSQAAGNTWRRVGQRLREAVLPSSCVLCGADSGSAPVCPACAADLPRLPSWRCPQCAEPTTHGERCGRCLAHPPAFDGTVALYAYDFPLDRLVHALKYGHQLALAGWFGWQLAPALADHRCDRIIPLPLHPRRLRERGFNQSTEIARAMGPLLSLPLDLTTLHRCRETRPQAELPLKERQGNLRSAFACSRDLGGAHILLVDDVMTSGATLDEAARVVKIHGAAAVTVAIVGRALRHG